MHCEYYDSPLEESALKTLHATLSVKLLTCSSTYSEQPVTPLTTRDAKASQRVQSFQLNDVAAQIIELILCVWNLPKSDENDHLNA